jgi:hypothetical protein
MRKVELRGGGGGNRRHRRLPRREKIEKTAQGVSVERTGRYGRAQVVFRKLHENPPARIDAPWADPLSRVVVAYGVMEVHGSAAPIGNNGR